jgi:hypothetical protein
MDVAFDCFLARKSMATCEELHKGYIIHIEQLIGLDLSQTKVSIAFVDWAFHFMEQVKVVHQLVINTTPSTLYHNHPTKNAQSQNTCKKEAKSPILQFFIL